jgi:toxin ParE1/3/4
MLSVVRTERAEADLAETLDHLEERSPEAAEWLATAIDGLCNLLAQFPQLGRTREELAPGLRSAAIEPCVLFYRVTVTAVEVTAFFTEHVTSIPS